MKRIGTFCMAVAMTFAAHADTYDWTNGDGLPPGWGGDCLWSNKYNWDKVVTVPTSSDTVQISGNTALTPVIVDCNAEFFQLKIGPNNGSEGHVSLSAGGSMKGFVGYDYQYIGDRGTGHLVQTGGDYQTSSRSTILGNESTGVGFYSMSGGTHTDPWGAVIGNHGKGNLTLYGGTWSAADNVTTLGNMPGSTGIVKLYGGTFLLGGANSLRIGNQGCGEFIVDGGTLSFNRGCEVGYNNTTGPISKLHLLAGTVLFGDTNPNLYVGVYGKAEMKAKIPFPVGNFVIADQANSHGFVEWDGCLTNKFKTNTHLVIGKGGRGELVMDGGRMDGDGTRCRMTIRETQGAHGVLRGWGEVYYFINESGNPPLVNNGQVIADGGGEDHDLKFTGFDHLNHFVLVYAKNTLANDNTNGWYARNGGRLLIPGVYVGGAGNCFWGEDSSFGALSMVNSVRVKIDAKYGVHTIFNVQVLAPDRTDIPPLPNKGSPVGLWYVSFDRAGFPAMQISELEVRYDHVASRGAVPELYQYNPNTTEWVKLTVTAQPGHCVMATDFQLFNENNLGYIAAIKPQTSNLFYLK